MIRRKHVVFFMVVLSSIPEPFYNLFSYVTRRVLNALNFKFEAHSICDSLEKSNLSLSAQDCRIASASYICLVSIYISLGNKNLNNLSFVLKDHMHHIYIVSTLYREASDCALGGACVAFGIGEPTFPKQNEPRHEKTCLRGFRPCKTQTSLLSYRDKLEA